ncbi:hypothetical protein FGO68_gene8450 [Halteria grandinella]|uniref:Uncharacterized protein n=1 Tax=Halteria grandinella TaxID=5974 RepID=A0A8J8NAI5_HALGN|nr:hypothetical protein FGO68_gene8450 [Halteria grandinella]
MVSGFKHIYLISHLDLFGIFSMEKKLTKPEELLSRFRSKEDLYRYMTVQGKYIMICMTYPCSECVPSVTKGHEGRIYEGHFIRYQIISQIQ